MAESEGFLSRWSRRKRQTRRRRGGAAPVLAEPSAPEPEPRDERASPDPVRPQSPTSPPPVATGPSPESRPAEGAEEAPPDLPPIESLDKDSDFTVFLKDNVPEELRRLALRKLWRTDPVFANLDGLNDYDENFRVLMRAIGRVATNYKVGRGFLEEDVGEAEAEDMPAEPATEAEQGPQGPGEERERPEDVAARESGRPSPEDRPGSGRKEAPGGGAQSGGGGPASKRGKEGRTS